MKPSCRPHQPLFRRFFQCVSITNPATKQKILRDSPYKSSSCGLTRQNLNPWHFVTISFSLSLSWTVLEIVENKQHFFGSIIVLLGSFLSIHFCAPSNLPIIITRWLIQIATENWSDPTDDPKKEDFYGAQYYHILLLKNDSYINRFILYYWNVD